MAKTTLRGTLLIWLSFFIALVLQTMPWPGELSAFRPSWVLLVAFYWTMALPHRVNVGMAFIVGLLWDLMLGSTLGVRAAVMSILIYLVALNFQVIRNLSLWQQATLLALLTLLGKGIEFFGEFLVSNVKFDPSVLVAGILNFLLWPWLFFLLRRVRRHFSIK